MQLTAILTTNPSVTRILVRADDDVVLKAALLPRSWPHRRALPTLLESLALWHQARAHAVICAADLDSWSRLGLVDDLGAAAATIHYAVEVREPGRRRSQRIPGLGSYRDVRQLELGGVR